MKERLKALSNNPLAWVLALLFLGSANVVAGVAIAFGAGPSFMTAGVFLLGFAVLLMRGMKPNG